MSIGNGIARSICLEGTCNFRDVGGAPINAGGAVRHGILFRSDAIDELTPRDCNVLQQTLRIRSVIDLRSTTEATNRRASLLVDSLYLSVPLLNVGAIKFEPSEGCLLAQEYVYRLHSDANLPVAIQTLAVAVAQPVIVHCAGGKDRTGIVIALTLALAGVTKEAIIADYMLTADNLPRLMQRVAARKFSRPEIGQLPPEMYECPREAIEAFLVAIEGFGGAEGWALSAGISTYVIDHLRSNLCERE